MGDPFYFLPQLYGIDYRKFLVMFASEECLVWGGNLRIFELLLNTILTHYCHPTLHLFKCISCIVDEGTMAEPLLA